MIQHDPPTAPPLILSRITAWNVEIVMARTPKARALGAALRQAREGKELRLRELAEAINRDIGVLSRWENGERAPKPEQVAQILTKLGVDGERYDDIMTLAYGTNESQWVATTLPEQRQQMIAYTDWEQNATRIVEVAPLLIPGLLQTRDYAEAMMTAPGAGLAAEEIETRVAARLDRREVLIKHNPAHLLVLLGVGALAQGIGGWRVMMGQLRYLLEMATNPNIELRVIPNNCGWHPGLETAFALIESSRPASVVFVGTRRSPLMLHENSDVSAYRQAVDYIFKVSVQPEASARLIADIHQRMENHGDN
jgi:transcriptional regulator with XRE-family HTH domain